MEEGNDEVRVPLDFRGHEDMPLAYATTVVVQHTQDEFVLSFFSVAPPILLGEPEHVRQKQDELNAIPARCVARIVMSPSRMAQLVEVVKGNLAMYEERFGALSEVKQEATQE